MKNEITVHNLWTEFVFKWFYAIFNWNQITNREIRKIFAYTAYGRWSPCYFHHILNEIHRNSQIFICSFITGLRTACMYTIHSVRLTLLTSPAYNGNKLLSDLVLYQNILLFITIQQSIENWNSKRYILNVGVQSAEHMLDLGYHYSIHNN